MPSRSQKELREGTRVQGRRRETSIGEDLKDSAAGIGKAIGGFVGGAGRKIRERGADIDREVDDAS